MSGAVQRARGAWGTDIPPWVLRLAEYCEETSQNRTAKTLGISSSLISQVIHAKYPGDLNSVEAVVTDTLMKIQCPVLGAISPDDCHLWRARAGSYSGHNDLRVRMFRACNGCARNGGGQA